MSDWLNLENEKLSASIAHRSQESLVTCLGECRTGHVIFTGHAALVSAFLHSSLNQASIGINLLFDYFSSTGIND